MKKTIKILSLLTFVLFFFALNDAEAQCAMCKATIENKIEQGASTGSGLNQGILYLMAIPYILISLVGFFWYKKTRKDAAAKRLKVDFSKL